MTDQEAAQAYEDLASALEEYQLGWVRDQVEAFLDQGKTELREVALLDEVTLLDEKLDMQAGLAMPVHRKRPGPRSSFLATVDYTSKEKLRQLAIAIAHAVPHPLEMVSSLVVSLDSAYEASRPLRILAVRESGDGDVEPRALEVETPEEKVTRFREILYQLVTEAEK